MRRLKVEDSTQVDDIVSSAHQTRISFLHVALVAAGLLIGFLSGVFTTGKTAGDLFRRVEQLESEAEDSYLCIKDIGERVMALELSQAVDEEWKNGVDRRLTSIETITQTILDEVRRSR